MHGATPRLISLSSDIAIGPPPLPQMCTLNKYDVHLFRTDHFRGIGQTLFSNMDLVFKG